MVGNGDYSNTTEFIILWEYIKMSDSQKDSFIMSNKKTMTLNTYDDFKLARI
jgi:hypothetical protein